ncbi:gamma-glutamyl-gamma-aminobutyrate hydrolase family protein [Pseudomarimonas salicorniae]|uniref:Gamma-glutamyl-gamma-aminobutyrate hydrolase family protein n=1 Tax=Pseudomarimonas salicorniae TaxID=2933270 RepID=A0ABT0GI24_9GAMM|nr:gamma-glutamyl-gamma-aminobutyrate hydrolase family protein [Lysobacter sp. CAU 1642]MCK7594199.1 gamma-glutamyl-gamma-aminobutyrate hydrolase family protein [Lysobacter sp. CAU 1642]
MAERAGRPIVLVSGPDAGGTLAWWAAALAIRRVGGRPVRYRPRDAGELPDFDALLLGGGADIDPSHYGEGLWDGAPDRPAKGGLLGQLFAPVLFVLRWILSSAQYRRGDVARDVLELQLIRAAEQRRLPVLGICRGAQLLNIAAGGSLHQDLSGFYGESPQLWTLRPLREVVVEPDSRLAEALGCTRLAVNALHRQAVDRLGAGVRVVAREGNGVVQAIEGTGPRWWIGVQWHPEYLPWRSDQLALFARLLQAARVRRRADAARAAGGAIQAR